MDKEFTSNLQDSVHFVQVAERFEHEAVHATGEQPRYLASKQGLRVGLRRWAEGLDADAKWSDRADDARPPARRGACEVGRSVVDFLGVVCETVAVELQRIGAEGVGLQDLGACAHVLGVHFLHQPWLLQTQLVVADVQEEALAVQHRAHGPVEDVDPAVIQECAEGGSHRENNNPLRTYS